MWDCSWHLVLDSTFYIRKQNQWREGEGVEIYITLKAAIHDSNIGQFKPFWHQWVSDAGMLGYSSSHGCWLSEYKSWHGRIVHPCLEWVEKSAKCLSISLPALRKKSMYGHSMGFHSMYILLMDFPVHAICMTFWKICFPFQKSLFTPTCKTSGKFLNAVFAHKIMQLSCTKGIWAALQHTSEWECKSNSGKVFDRSLRTCIMGWMGKAFWKNLT